MFRTYFAVTFVFVCLLSFLAAPASAQGYDDIKLETVSAPNGFENGVSYEVSYFQKLNGIPFEVFPTRIEKEKDLDLILAQVNEITARVSYIQALVGLYAAEGTLLERRGVTFDDISKDK